MAGFFDFAAAHPVAAVLSVIIPGVLAYLYHINSLMSRTPDEILRHSKKRWTRRQVLEAYERVAKQPLTPESYRDELPPKLERRYIVTGGSGECAAGNARIWHHPPAAAPDDLRRLRYRGPADMT
jgi:hypothetical protein